MKIRKYKLLIMSLLALALLMFSSVGCEKKGEAEKAGEKIDQTLNSVKDKFKEVTK